MFELVPQGYLLASVKSPKSTALPVVENSTKSIIFTLPPGVSPPANNALVGDEHAPSLSLPLVKSPKSDLAPSVANSTNSTVTAKAGAPFP